MHEQVSTFLIQNRVGRGKLPPLPPLLPQFSRLCLNLFDLINNVTQLGNLMYLNNDNKYIQIDIYTLTAYVESLFLRLDCSFFFSLQPTSRDNRQDSG